MSSRKFKGSLTFTYIQLILFSTYFTGSAVDVMWDAKLPVVFGNVTYLQCNISDTTFDCSNGPLQWIGGSKYEPLCYEDNCPTSKKYEVMKQSCCLYTLLIHNFSELDVNLDYTCSYGVSRMRRNLTLDEKRFIYEPHVEDIKEEVIEKDKTLDWRIDISKIFPKPICGADLNAESITDSLQISVTKPGFYFAAALQINLLLSSCGKLDVYCYLGEYKINITSKNFNSCQFKGGENNKKNTVMMGLIIFAIILVIAVFMGCMCRKKYGNRHTFINVPVEKTE